MSNHLEIIDLMNENTRLRNALQMFVAHMVEYGIWDDGCFYYNGRSASELQEPITAAKAALKTAEGKPV